MEAVKTMIHDQDLPMHSWAEATRTSIYVQNIVSHSEIGFKISEEMFIGKKPNLSHLNIFVFPVFVHIPKEKRAKLDPSRKKGIFVGNYEVSMAFIVYISGYHHMDISKDVTFDEDETLKKLRKCQPKETYEELVAPRAAEPMKEVTPSHDDEISEEHDMLEPHELPHVNISHERNPTWVCDIIQEA